MKKFVLSTLLLFAATTMIAGVTPSISGQWNIHNTIAGTESDQVCTFTQKDKELAGSCQTDQGSAAVTGKIGEKNVTWEYKSEWNGSPLTLIYTGTLDASSKITGSVEVQPMAVTGEFSAEKAK